MRKLVQLIGVLLVAAGVSGTIDHLAHQPFMGFLNVFNRYVFPHVSVLKGYEIFANLIVAVLGVVVIVAATRTASTRDE